jgi:protein gp37
MSAETEIAWTDSTWNPVSGCTPASPGCDHCYAARLAKRLPAAHQQGRSFSDVVCHEERLDVPLHWRKPRRVFVCSMGDLFHELVPFDFIDAVFDVMSSEGGMHHTYQVLTKRPARMLEFLEAYYVRDLVPPLGNVWLGVTAEDQQRADERIPLLLRCPAAVRFISVEPMLGPVNRIWPLDWIICGGESGPRARPMHPYWVRSLRDQCKTAGVPFFFKQWGEYVAWSIADDGTVDFRRIGKRAAGRTLDRVTHDEFPEVGR